MATERKNSAAELSCRALHPCCMAAGDSPERSTPRINALSIKIVQFLTLTQHNKSLNAKLVITFSY
jgi:hypothetical protein